MLQLLLGLLQFPIKR